MGKQCREKYTARAGGMLLPAELAARQRVGGRATSCHFMSFLKFLSPISPLRVPMVLQVPRVWLVRGALLVFLGSVVREDSLAFLAHR